MGTAIRFSQFIFIVETKPFDERKIGGCPHFLLYRALPGARLPLPAEYWNPQ